VIALRERCGLTQAQVAERAGVSKATVCHYEMWQDRARIRWATVKALADACDPSVEERDALVRVAKSQTDGWRVSNSAVPEWMDPLVSFEHEAAYEHVYANTVVPGLLQTRAYALAIHQAREMRSSGEEIEGMVEARIQRQHILRRDDERNPLNSMAVVYIEMRRRGLYLDDAEDIGSYKLRSTTFVRRRPTPRLLCGCWPKPDMSCPVTERAPSGPRAPIWFKSSHSGAEGNECVGVTALRGRIGVRDSKAPGGPVLSIAADAWAAFVGGVRGGEIRHGA
jgi:DNA-binding XRE family transcriptional regulator